MGEWLGTKRAGAILRRMKMGLVKWEAGREQAAMSPCTSLLSYVMPNTLMGIRSWVGSVTNGRKGK